MKRRPKRQPKTIHVSSGYGGNTRRPYVEIEFTERRAQLSPAEARDLAVNLLQAAEGAESDAFLVEFMTDKIGADLPSAGSILLQFRQWREALWREKYGNGGPDNERGN